MGSFSLLHWLIVLFIIMLLFGTRRLPGMMTDLAGAVRAFRKGLQEGESEVAHSHTPPPQPAQLVHPEVVDAEVVDRAADPKPAVKKAPAKKPVAKKPVAAKPVAAKPSASKTAVKAVSKTVAKSPPRTKSKTG